MNHHQRGRVKSDYVENLMEQLEDLEKRNATLRDSLKAISARVDWSASECRHQAKVALLKEGQP